jgi:hypothetical protein
MTRNWYTLIATLGILILPSVFVYAQTAAILPSPIDLLIDSDSYVPPYYLGRALPSPGSHIRLVAIPYFKDSNGSKLSSSDIDFTWKQNGRVLGSLSGIGKSSITVPAAILYGTSNIEVDVQSVDGTSYGTALAVLPSIESTLVLYEDDPLLGITYYRALPASVIIPETEMTFAAIPYFAAVQGSNDSRLVYAWTVNGSTIKTDMTNLSEITINAKNSTGMASIGLSLTQSNNIFMSPAGSWSVMIGSSAANAFKGTSAGTKNVFTGQTQ